jgi:hypothetical protein
MVSIKLRRYHVVWFKCVCSERIGSIDIRPNNNFADIKFEYTHQNPIFKILNQVIPLLFQDLWLFDTLCDNF